MIPYGFVYRVVDPYTEMSYIGQSTKPLRFIQHAHYQEYLRMKREKINLLDHPFYYAIDKLGISHFIWEVLCECSNQKELNTMEQKAINYYAINGGIYNTKITVYGSDEESLPKPDENFEYDRKTIKVKPETVAKMSSRKKTPEHIEKVRLANIGRKHTLESRMKISASGKTVRQSEEYKKKQSEALKKAFARPEVKEKLSKIRKGRKLSEEHKKKIGIARSGYTMSEETKKKKSEIMNAMNYGRKKFIVTFPDGHEEEVLGIKKFCREHGLIYSSWNSTEYRGRKKYRGYSKREVLDKDEKI